MSDNSSATSADRFNQLHQLAAFALRAKWKTVARRLHGAVTPHRRNRQSQRLGDSQHNLPASALRLGPHQHRSLAIQFP